MTLPEKEYWIDIKSYDLMVKAKVGHKRFRRIIKIILEDDNKEFFIIKEYDYEIMKTIKPMLINMVTK